MQILPIDELREIRRRLSEEADGDVAKYAAMLRETSTSRPEARVTEPLPVRAPDTTPAIP